MFQQLTSRMEFFSQSLQLRAHRQQVIASNIANADTAGFVARDFDPLENTEVGREVDAGLARQQRR